MNTTPPAAVLARYDLGGVRGAGRGGGTAGMTWRITTASGAYLLRMRGMRTSTDQRLEFDHGLREHLVERGVPTVAAVRTRDGARWCAHEGRVFELYPFVEGWPYDAGVTRETAAAAEASARYHLAAASYPARWGWHEAIRQYTGLDSCNQCSERLDDPLLLAAQLRSMRALAGGPEAEALLERCLARTARLADSYEGESYARLADWVIHGDYTPANLLFSERGEVVGIFDLDWASPATRCRDLADGLYFFGARRTAVHSGDIWSLTEAVEWDEASARSFLSAYRALAPLSEDELRAIPEAFAARWLSIRLEGMAKVAPAERWRFFSREVERPLQWLDEHWGALLALPLA